MTKQASTGKGESTTELLDRVFRDPATKQGLKVFTKNERSKLRLRVADGKVEVYCVEFRRNLIHLAQ